MNKSLMKLQLSSILLVIAWASANSAEEWYRNPLITATQDPQYLKEVREWHSDEYLRSGGMLNMRYFVDSAMVDALPTRINRLTIGLREGEVERLLSQGFSYAWGFNTASHGLESIPEGVRPEKLTFLYKLTEINEGRTATRNRFDLLIHWKCHYTKDGFELTYLDAKLIPPRKG